MKEKESINHENKGCYNNHLNIYHTDTWNFSPLHLNERSVMERKPTSSNSGKTDKSFKKEKGKKFVDTLQWYLQKNYRLKESFKKHLF